MRLISQDGTLDIPYEQTAVEISPMYPNEIEVTLALGNYKMAKYSSPRKALKVMEMLREEYLKYRKLGGNTNSLGNGVIPVRYYVLPKVFKFPKDEEVEV